jgi:hypothetical protein
MSLKNTIYTLIIGLFMLLIGCSSKSEDENVFIYYLKTDEHLGIEKGAKVFSLNYEIGEISDIVLGKTFIVYQLTLNQDNLFFYDSEIVITENVLTLDNQLSKLGNVAIGDTLMLSSSLPLSSPLDFSLPEKTAITQEDIDSLQQKINNLSNLIEELNGHN